MIQNNANEGPLFTPQNIVTEDDFVHFLQNTFPLFTHDNISQILQYYPSTNASTSNTTLKFATSGNSTPTAVNESTFGTGQQQRADVSPHLSLSSSNQHSAFLFASLNATTNPPKTEPLRRINLRLPFLLASRRLHKHEPQSLQVSILRHRRRARLRRILLHGLTHP